MARRPIPSEIRATALQRLAIAGPAALKSVAKECGVAPSTLREWWNEHKKTVPSVAPPPVPTEPKPAGSPPAGPATKPAAGTAAAAAEAEASRQGVTAAPATAAAPAPAPIVDGGPQLMALIDGVNIMAVRGCALALGVKWTDELAGRAALSEKDKLALSANSSAAAVILLPMLRDFTKVSCGLFLANFGMCLMGGIAMVRELAPKKPEKKQPEKVQDKEPPTRPDNGHQAAPASVPARATRVVEQM